MASHRKLRSGNEWRNPFRQPEVVRKFFAAQQQAHAAPRRIKLTACILHALRTTAYQGQANA